MVKKRRKKERLKNLNLEVGWKLQKMLLNLLNLRM